MRSLPPRPVGVHAAHASPADSPRRSRGDRPSPARAARRVPDRPAAGRARGHGAAAHDLPRPRPQVLVQDLQGLEAGPRRGRRGDRGHEVQRRRRGTGRLDLPEPRRRARESARRRRAVTDGHGARRRGACAAGCGAPAAEERVGRHASAGWRLTDGSKRDLESSQGRSSRPSSPRTRSAVLARALAVRADVGAGTDRCSQPCTSPSRSSRATSSTASSSRAAAGRARPSSPVSSGIAKSFRCFDEKAKDVESIDVLDGVNISAERRREIERGMVKGWNVVVSPKKNYIVIYNTKHNKNHLLAKEIARAHRADPRAGLRGAVPAGRARSTRCRSCASAATARSTTPTAAPAAPRATGTAGPRSSSSTTRARRRSPTTTRSRSSITRRSTSTSTTRVGNVAPHSWFNEGHGDYYAGAELKGRKFKIDALPLARGRHQERDRPRAARQGRGPRTKTATTTASATRETTRATRRSVDLVRFTQREYYSYPGVCYAQGWSLIYFLREIVPKNKKYSEKWGNILDVYFDTLKGEVASDPDEANDGERHGARDEDEDAEPEDGPGDEPGDAPDDEDGHEDGEGEAEEEAPAAWIPPPMMGGRGGAAALERAVAAAFDGVDFAELEAAWATAVKKDM